MNTPETTRARRSMWSAVDLLAHDFPEPRWAVPGILPEGLTLLAGPPKVGKSWLSLNLGVSVATGTNALGTIPVEQGHVLYLALEDTPRRLQRRLETVLPANQQLDGLGFAVEWPAMPNGGADLLHETLTATPETRLVIVDVLAKVRGTVDGRGGSLYDTDYASMGHLKRVADEHNIAVVVIHHVRKSGSEDFLETISGTNGLAGAADTIAVLRRSRNAADAVLSITGRDVEEAEHALKFDASNGTWTLLDGPAGDYDLGPTRRAILQHLREAPGSRPSEVADALGLDRELTKKTCRRMADDDQLTVATGGRYSVAVPTVPAVPEGDLTSENTEELRGQVEMPLSLLGDNPHDVSPLVSPLFSGENPAQGTDRDSGDNRDTTEGGAL